MRLKRNSDTQIRVHKFNNKCGTCNVPLYPWSLEPQEVLLRTLNLKHSIWILPVACYVTLSLLVVPMFRREKQPSSSGVMQSKKNNYWFLAILLGSSFNP